MATDPIYYSSLTEGDFNPTQAMLQSMVEGDFPFPMLVIADTNPAGELAGQYRVAQFGDSQCALLLHFGGVDGATSVVDSAPNEKTAAAAGSFELDDTQKEFGDTSGYFTTASDVITVDYDSELSFGSGDFTIDLHVRFEEAPTSTISFFRQYNAAGTFVEFYWVAGGTNRLVFTCEIATVMLVWIPSSILTWEIDQWYHLAVTRSGNTWTIFRDGVVVGSDSDVSGLPTWTDDITINYGGGLRGWIDEYRIVKGRAEWAAAFDVPAEAYVAGTYQLYRATDDDPDFSAAAAETFFALPWRSESLAADHEYRHACRYQNEYELASLNRDLTIIDVAADGSEEPAKPSGPDWVKISPAADNEVTVQAGYMAGVDGDDAADSWLVYLTDTGVDPDPDLDSATEISMQVARGALTLLNYTTTAGSYDDGDTIKLLVRTRRSGTPDVDSANVDIYSTTANDDGPAAPAVAAFAAGKNRHG